MIFGSYIFSQYFKVSNTYLVWANIIFFAVETLTLLTVYYLAIKQEEVTDTRTLAYLTNSINKS